MLQKAITPFYFPVIMVKAIIYNYTGNRNTVNKTLTGGTECLGVLRDITNVTTPKLVLRVSAPINANYCYIQEFKRYYFIKDITYLTGDKVQLDLNVDVLKTYETQILNATATITETENPDKYASNRQTVYNRKPNFEKIDFENQNLFDETGTIIMVTIKGNN